MPTFRDLGDGTVEKTTASTEQIDPAAELAIITGLQSEITNAQTAIAAKKTDLQAIVALGGSAAAAAKTVLDSLNQQA